MEEYAIALSSEDQSGEAGLASIDLWRALTTLSENEKTAMVLVYGFGMSHTEVSNTMGEPLGTVKSWVQRGKIKLKGELESYDHEMTNG
ncbi:MAG: RNA polymerase sigma factor [bacterium]